MRGGTEPNFKKRSRRRGRPSWQPPNPKIVELLALGGSTLDDIAASLGIDRATLFRKKQQAQEFCDAINRGRVRSTLAISNALLEQVKAGNVAATIRMLKRLGWNKTDTTVCPDPGYITRIRRKKWRKKFLLLQRYMTDRELNVLERLCTLPEQRKAAAGSQTDIREGQEKVRDDSCQRREAAKPASRRTGRPAWSPPEAKVVESLAERGLSLAQIALYLKINRTTLFRRKRTDEDFAAAIARGRARAIAFAADKLFDQAQKGKVRAIIFFLKKTGWGEGHVEHVHGLGCFPAEERERQGARFRFLTTLEKREYLDIIRKAEQRMMEAGARIRDDGLDEWGNEIKPPR